MAIDVTQLEGLVNPFVVFWNSLMLNLPGIIAAIVIIILGYLVGVLVGFVVKKIVEKTKVDKWMAKTARSDAIGGLELSVITGKLIKWWIFILFLTPAANMIKLERLAQILTATALWAPHLIAGIIILLLGLVVADFLADSAAHAKKLKGIKAISSVIRIIVIIFFADIALREVGINIVLAETSLLMILGGLILVFVIGFGVALIKPAEKIIEGWVKKIK